MNYLFAPPPPASIPIAGDTRRFPVRRIYCVGRNYADHAIEMGIDPRTDPPFYFCKPADTIMPAAKGCCVRIAYPAQTQNLHHEVELVLAIGTGGQDIAVDQAMQHIWGYAVGIDLTRRDLQLNKRALGQPWEIGKTFDGCAPIGPLHPISATENINAAGISITVDGEVRQSSRISKLIWPLPEIVADLSRYFPLHPGDLIFTGTPEGVGPLLSGQRMVAHIDGLTDLEVEITPPVHGERTLK